MLRAEAIKLWFHSVGDVRCPECQQEAKETKAFEWIGGFVVHFLVGRDDSWALRFWNLVVVRFSKELEEVYPVDRRQQPLHSFRKPVPAQHLSHAPSDLHARICESDFFNNVGEPWVMSHLHNEIEPNFLRPPADDIAPARSQIF